MLRNIYKLKRSNKKGEEERNGRTMNKRRKTDRRLKEEKMTERGKSGTRTGREEDGSEG